MKHPRPPPPDPRLLELLPELTRRVIARSKVRRHPIDSDDVRSIVAYTLFRYFRRYPEGTADDHRRRAYMRCCNAVVDTIRISGVRRTHPGPSTGDRFGFDPLEIRQAIEAGWLPRAVVTKLGNTRYDDEVEAIDPAPFVDELLMEKQDDAGRIRLLHQAPGCTDKQREAVRMVLLEGMQYRSAAAVLGVSEPRVSQLLYAAAVKLRHQWLRPAAENRPRRRRVPNRPKPSTPPDASTPP